MPVQDADPERRNLFVTSAGFVLFELAGGEIKDDVVLIQVVNVEFQRPDVLAVAAWIVLFWFAYRYWVTHRGLIRTGVGEEIKSQCKDTLLSSYVKYVTGERVVSDNEDGLHVRDLRLHPGAIAAILMYAERVGRDSSGKVHTHKGSQNRGGAPNTLLLNGVLGRLVACWLCTKCMAFQPTLSSYLVPWFIFLQRLFLASCKNEDTRDLKGQFPKRSTKTPTI